MSNAIPPSPPSGPNRRLLALAQQLIDRNNWQLMNAEDLAGHVRAEADLDMQTDQYVQQMLKWIYSEQLYIACSGTEGQERKERGYTELMIYLQRIAQKLYSDIADKDLVQAALLEVCQRFAEVRKPSAFLTWTFFCLRSAVSQRLRQDHGDSSLEQSMNGNGTSLAERLPAPDSDPQQQLAERDGHDELWEIIHELRRKHPRAVDQFNAFLWHYVNGMSNEEIAKRLGVDLNQVYVRRARAVKKIRDRIEEIRGKDGE